MILTASVSQNARMTRGETVIISAVVTDPDGINDLIGGSLTDPTGHSTYGVFATSASEGAYSLTVSWSDFNHVSVIEFVNQEHRDAVMHFFDAEGHETKQTLSVTLHCDGAGGSACGGECKDLQTDENNCGRCNTQCVGGCTVGACLPRLEPAGAPSDNRSCDTACAKMKTPNGRALSCAAECPSANATVAGVATYRWQHNDWNKPVTTCDQNVPPAFYSDAFTSWALFELSCCCR